MLLREFVAAAAPPKVVNFGLRIGPAVYLDKGGTCCFQASAACLLYHVRGARI